MSLFLIQNHCSDLWGAIFVWLSQGGKSWFVIGLHSGSADQPLWSVRLITIPTLSHLERMQIIEVHKIKIVHLMKLFFRLIKSLLSNWIIQCVAQSPKMISTLSNRWLRLKIFHDHAMLSQLRKKLIQKLHLLAKILSFFWIRLNSSQYWFLVDLLWIDQKRSLVLLLNFNDQNHLNKKLLCLEVKGFNS